jgi:AcrR family transcriptional regulator
MGEELSVDRRITRTRISIRNALVALIEEKGFENLSVSDIASKADINRGTFYLHYKDKFELLEQTVDDVVQELEKIFRKARSLRFADFISTDEPLPILVEIFEYVKENEALTRVIFGLGGGVAFQAKVRNMVENNLKLGFLSTAKAENFLVPREYLISYIMHAHFGVIQSWLENGCKETPQAMARILSRLSLDGPMRATGFDLNRT